MQPGDTHQVRDAGAVEELPLLARDRALVAHRQRGEDAGGGCRSEHRVEAIAHRLARALDVIERRMALAEPPRLGPRAHVAGRADAALEEPRLVIEAVRIDEPMRPAQAHRERPALARVHAAGERRSRRLLGARVPVPGEKKRLGQAGGVRAFDLELEAHAALRHRRQRRDDADDPEITPFEVGWQPVAHAPVRAGGRPEKAGGQCRCDEDGAIAQSHHQQDRQAKRPAERGQRRRELQQGRARGERQRG